MLKAKARVSKNLILHISFNRKPIMVVGGTALFGGGRGGATQSKALVEFRAGKMTTATGSSWQ